jgi:hypothetical protein
MRNGIAACGNVSFLEENACKIPRQTHFRDDSGAAWLRRGAAVTEARQTHRDNVNTTKSHENRRRGGRDTSTDTNACDAHTKEHGRVRPGDDSGDRTAPARRGAHSAVRDTITHCRIKKNWAKRMRNGIAACGNVSFLEENACKIPRQTHSRDDSGAAWLRRGAAVTEARQAH